MSFTAMIRSDMYAAQHERSPLDQAMHVAADADAKHKKTEDRNQKSEVRSASASSKSSSHVILMLRRLPSTMATFTPRRSTKELSSVKSGSETFTRSYARRSNL